MMRRMTQWLFGLGLLHRPTERIEITVETNETWGVEWFGQSQSELCPLCGVETIFIPPDLGAQFVQADVKRIRELIEMGQVHFNVGKSQGLICLNSLKRTTDRNALEKIITES